MKKVIFFAFMLPWLFYCAAPRSVSHTGRVTQKRHFTFGADVSGNVPSSILKALYSGLENAISDSLEGDSLLVDRTTLDMTEALLTYSLDPITATSGFYIRYGLINRMDIGFRMAGGVKVFDARYQFLGPLAGEKGGDGAWYGSVGVQYSGQDYVLPSVLGKLQEILGYEMKRKDIFVPLVFSRSFGPDEKFGAFSTGLAYNYTMASYKYKPNLVYKLVASQYEKINDVPQDEESYSSLGLFVNGKAGFKFVYVILSLALYYQNYGEYSLLGEDTVEISGITFIPNLSLQLAF